jgi:replicative DNA helicase
MQRFPNLNGVHPAQDIERLLPNSSESERAILGSVLLDSALIVQTIELLKPEDFYLLLQRRVFIAMSMLFESQLEINPILLIEALRRDGSLEPVIDSTFITKFTYGLPHVTTIANYAKVVKDKSLLRQFIKVTNKVTSDALADAYDFEVILEHAEQAIFALRANNARAKSSARIYCANDLLAYTFAELKWAVPGLIPEGAYILARRPKLGKSWVVLGFSVAVASGSWAWETSKWNAAMYFI